MRGDEKVITVIKKFGLIVLTPVVLGELFSGFMIGNRRERNLQIFWEFYRSNRVNLIELGLDDSNCYAAIVAELRSKGKPIPTNDIWIAASAMAKNLPIFTYDKHFNYIDGITAGSDF